MVDISWLTPSNGTTFSPVDKIHVQWKASRPAICPSFRLCFASGHSPPPAPGDHSATAKLENCGVAVWPSVKEKTGIYFTSFAVPNDLTAQDTFILRMEDDFGLVSESPCFFFTPSNPLASAEGVGSDPSIDTPQAPLGVHAKARPSPPYTSVIDTSGKSPSPTANLSTTWHPGYPRDTSNLTSASPITKVLLSQRPPNIAYFAVHLAVVAGILLLAILLAIRHRRKLAKERATDVERPTLSRQSNGSILETSDDIEYTLDSPSRKTPMPIPPFMPVDLPDVPSRSQRKSVPVSSTYTNARPAVKNSIRSSGALSTRSTYSPVSAYLPPKVSASQGLIDEERENPTSHSAIGDYFHPSSAPSPSTPEPPPRAHVPDYLESWRVIGCREAQTRTIGTRDSGVCPGLSDSG